MAKPASGRQNGAMSLPRPATLALWSIPVALGVMGLKFAAAWITGSVALLSDALESVINVLAAFMALSAIRISQRPADPGHPFGHHKAEYFSAVVEGVLIVVAALVIFREAAVAMFDPAPVASPGPGLAINALAATANGFWAWLLIRTGRAHRSPALLADGRHVLTDVVTSAGVLAGLVLALATGWTILDPLLALVVAANILREGWKLVRASVGGLMDAAVEADEAERIERTILACAAGALEVHDIRARRAGPALFVEFHLVVDGAMSVKASHAICDRIEGGLRTAFPGAHVTIHVEPRDEMKPEGLEVTPDLADRHRERR